MVRVDNHLSDAFSVSEGVRQGYVLSPILFNIYGEYVMRKVLEGWDGGISVGGVGIFDLRYADDTTRPASSEEEIVRLLNKLEKVRRNTGSISIRKKQN